VTAVPEVVLVYPRTGMDVAGVRMYLPLGLLATASLLAEQGVDVQLIDQRKDPRWEQSLGACLERAPLYVGISAMTGAQIAHGLAASRLVRQHGSTPIVWGGIHASLLPDQTAADPDVDIVVRGPGEYAAVDLASALQRGGPLAEVEGITWQENGRIHRTDDRPFPDLDALPHLPLDLLELGAYRDTDRSFPFCSSRGCPFRCAYCCNSTLSRSRWFAMSADRVIRELEEVRRAYRFDTLILQDENFLVDRHRALEIARWIGGRFRWYMQCRIDDVDRFDFAQLRRWGLMEIQPGLESGSPRILERIHKDVTVEAVIEYNRRLAAVDVVSSYNFLMGLPGETTEDVAASVRLALRLLEDNPHSEIAGFYTYSPYPGTELFELALEQGFEPPRTLLGWSEMSRHHRATPWVVESRDRFEALTLTSKFVDGRRFQRLFPDRRVIGLALGRLAALYRRRWRRGKLDHTRDTRLLRRLLERRVDL